MLWPPQESSPCDTVSNSLATRKKRPGTGVLFPVSSSHLPLTSPSLFSTSTFLSYAELFVRRCLLFHHHLTPSLTKTSPRPLLPLPVSTFAGLPLKTYSHQPFCLWTE